MVFKIAIIGSFNFHNECIGFLCENIINNNYIDIKEEIYVNIYYNLDTFKYVDYFKKLYPTINTYNSNNISEIESNNLIIKLTSNDPIDYNPNYISILHLNGMKNISNKTIILSPLLLDNKIPFSSNSIDFYLNYKKLNYIFPFYSGIYERTHNNTISIIGYFDNNSLDNDLIKFINSSKYTFNIISYNTNGNCFRNYSNIVFTNTMSTEDMIKTINNSKFILARNQRYMNRDRFTGILTLAISHRTPIILGEYFAELYNIPAITYKENFCEIKDKINGMSDFEYNNELDRIDNFIISQGDYNKKKFASLIK
jgi:hypothetical protein